MTVKAFRQEAYIKLADGGRWRVVDGPMIESDVEMVRTAMGSKPDESWKHTDPHGHVHKYVRDAEGVPRLPSLEARERHVDCDGSCGGCEGYSITEWFCRECGDQEEPGFRHDYEAENPGIPVSRTTTFTFTVEMLGELPREPVTDAAFAYVAADGVEHEQSLPPLTGYEWQIRTGGIEGPVATVKMSGSRIDAVKRKPVGP